MSFVSANYSLRHGGLVEKLASLCARGWLGVPIFFVISGYCISASLARHRRGDETFSMRIYLLRRFRRIYPPYWAALALLVTGVSLVDYWLWPRFFSGTNLGFERPTWFQLSQWLGNVTLTESWRHHLGGAEKAYLLGPSWTLCFEEQFYLLAGLTAVLFGKRFFFGIGLISVLTAAVAALTRYRGVDISGLFLEGHWLLFALGVGAHRAVTTANRTLLRTAVAALAVLGGYFVWHPERFLFDKSGSHAFTLQVLFVGLAFETVLPWLHRHDAVISSTRWLLPLKYCGTLCYSLYLVHSPIVFAMSRVTHQLGLVSAGATLLITIPLSLAAALAAAEVFHRLVERRFLNSPRAHAASALE